MHQSGRLASQRDQAAVMMKHPAGILRFLEYPVLELSNNLAENAMRPVALPSNPKVTAEVRRYRYACG
jgi:hypothetical protein